MAYQSDAVDRAVKMGTSGYHSGYCAERDVRRNLAEVLFSILRLRELIPGFVTARYSKTFWGQIESGQVVLPLEAERWGILIGWSRLISTDYLRALRIVANVLDRQGSFDSKVLDTIESAGHIKMIGKTSPMLRLLSQQQPDCEILIAPIQLGLSHREKSVNEARFSLTPHETGFDLLNLLVQLLSNPRRLQSDRDLAVDDVGTQFYVSGIGRAPRVRFQKGVKVLEFSDPRKVSESSGSATFFGSWLRVW